MIYTLVAVCGAAIALIVRELGDKHDKLMRKRANCYHDYGEPFWHLGHGTRVCRRCGYQDFVEKEEK